MWNPPDAEFYIPQMPVALVNLYGSGAVDRSLLERLNCVVLCHAQERRWISCECSGKERWRHAT
jgi:hypothetical protein